MNNLTLKKVELLNRLTLLLISIAVLAVWLIIANSYLSKTPKNSYEYDLGGHIEYTQIIANQHRLPGPFEGWQTYHPPLYYLVDQTARPSSPDHVRYVRWYSVVYGGIFILLLLNLLFLAGVSPIIAVFATLFLISTPAFVQLFSAYNNDSLAMLMAGVSVFAFWKFLRSHRFWWLVLLFLATALGAYSKYSAIYASLALLVLAFSCWHFKQMAWRSLLLLAVAIGLGIATLFPWLIFHNKALSGQYLPENTESNNLGTIMESTRLSRNGGPLKFLFTPPGLSSKNEWKTPFAISLSRNGGVYDWTKKDLLSSILVTSAYGEFEYPNMPLHSPFTAWSWVVLWGQVATFLVLLLGFHKKMFFWLGLVALGVLTHVVHVSIVHQFLNDANYRYYLWISLPYFVALGIALNHLWKKGSLWRLAFLFLAPFLISHFLFFYYFAV